MSYVVRLYDIQIGSSSLEKSDAARGQVSGDLTFVNIESGYDFLSAYCKETESQINADVEELKFIEAEAIRGLNVVTAEGHDIPASQIVIRGLDSGTYEIELSGISASDYAALFPEYLAAYEQMFTLKLNG